VPPIPTSTYRLQITSDFPLTAAATVTGYLTDLGVGAVYLSPLLQATSGSEHGYDTVDVTRIDADRGGASGWQAVLTAAREHGLQVVVDIVPNHLGIAVPKENPAWWDLLTHGRDSGYAHWFDIDWSRPRIAVPILGEDQTLTIADGELAYFEHRFPLAPGSWSPGDDPGEVHARQHYELMHWSRGNVELNYRRFFAVTTLAGVRVEDDDVFGATHRLPLGWVADGVGGLRIDHPDGLVDPLGYLQRLAQRAPDTWITVEKILEPGEDLPAEWPVAGTTGYDAMREVNAAFIDPDAEQALTSLYQGLTGDTRTIAEHVEAGKRMVVEELLPAEVGRMAALAPGIDNVESALREVGVAFDVYRSYLPTGVERLDAALALAGERNPDLRPALEALSPRLHDPDDELALRMQQLSGATTAKGVEDTAYYRYARFVALNEVGGDPGEFGIGLDRFHELQARRQARAPEAMTSLSTHDTKRGEDVRARLAVLSELGEDWQRFAAAFLAAAEIPNRAFAYLLAQTLVGTGAIERERMHAYAEKAMREAADGTTWTDPDAGFEASVHAAVDLAYDDSWLRAAWDEICRLVDRTGWSNALGQKLVQLTMPGVPDVYQGTEWWEDSLVDPDNRRPVNFSARAAMLAGLDGPPPVDATGAAKLWVTASALRLRRERLDAFVSYTPILASGPAEEHALGFDRGGALTLATRLPVRLAAAGGWAATRLPLDGTWTDRLTGRTYDGPTDLAELLATYPVALLARP
jgi:(1->4)-alpha-D-glucan 1-alpha-D-glucosylmutase